MSLSVSSKLVEQARNGKVGGQDFIACIRESLPRAWQIVETLAKRKQSKENGVVKHAPRSMDDGTRGELLRMMASDAIRTAVEGYFGMMFAFQNCHSTAVFLIDEIEDYNQFTSIEAQILNQSPELRDC